MSARTILFATGELRARLVPPRRGFHALTRHVAGRRPTGHRLRGWPPGANSIHNLPAVRTISFARAIPKLATKLVTLPAMAGAVTVAGLTWLQYKAQQASNFASDLAFKTGNSVSEMASTLFGSAKDIADQTWAGVERTKDGAKELELPEWMSNMFATGSAESETGGGGAQGNGGGGPGKEPPNQSKTHAAAAATGAAAMYAQSEEDDVPQGELPKDDQMMMLTKKLIEIRNILSQIGKSGALTMPSIVVIGSQSSGKSSVLEAIVGHEFLPKGSNMVTRRPIELTLVNTPGVDSEYGEFTDYNWGKFTDFSQVQSKLTDLNLKVPAEECVSDSPIRLSIHSPNVPDLLMIDLPGYIQTANIDQPPELKQKIWSLCEKYIQAPNIILAISSASSDLANSGALAECKRVDPRGQRTIGVITKMDLVKSDELASILAYQKHPLRLGYVGVITKVPKSTGIFTRNTKNITTLVSKNEEAYFTAHPEFSRDFGLAVGSKTLRTKLVQVLENAMAASLESTMYAVKKELNEVSREFKTSFNNRPMTANSYLAAALNAFQSSFASCEQDFGVPRLQALLKANLDQRILDILAKYYWNRPVHDLVKRPTDLNPLSTLSQADESTAYWTMQFESAFNAFVEGDVGSRTTDATSNALYHHVEDLVAKSSLAQSPKAKETILGAARDLLNGLSLTASTQVENSIKPFKHIIESKMNGWTQSRETVAKTLTQELLEVEEAQKHTTAAIGGKRKLKEVVSFIDRVRSGEVTIHGDGSDGAGGFTAELLQTGQEAVFLRDRAAILRMRMLALKSRACSSYASGKNKCPEIFLDVVANNLSEMATLFLNVELVKEFSFQFPLAVEDKLKDKSSKEDIEQIVRADERVARHLDVIKRKQLLELVWKKCQSVKRLEEA